MEYIEKENGIHVVEIRETPRGSIVRKLIYKFTIKLTADKSTINADGIDTATLTAKIYNYLDESQDQAITLTVDVGGISNTIDTVNGEASFTFDSLESGEFTITVSYDGYRAGEVVINAN